MNMSEDVREKTENSKGQTLDAALFLEISDRGYALPTTVIAIVLFSVWSLRSEINLVLSYSLLIMYGLLAFTATKSKGQSMSVERVGSKVEFKFIRSGVSWKIIFDGILGSAIPILLAWFVTINAFTGTPEISQVIMLGAMILFILIHPLLPSIGSMPRIRFCKTTVSSIYDLEQDAFVQFTIAVHELDRPWTDLQKQEAIRPPLEDKVRQIIQERLDINSS